MKEATGELNMTIVTLVAISAIAALLWFVIWPMIQKMIVTNTCKTYGDSFEAFKVEGLAAENGDAEVNKWQCCEVGDDGNKAADGQCFDAE